jgi:type III secretory pathway component EscS
MMLFRALLLLAVLGVLVCLAAYIWTRQKRYLQYALKLLQIMIVCGLIFFGVLILERLF